LDPAAESLAAKAGSESILEETRRFQALLSEESQRQYGNENTLKRPL
jgi:hypothetical protein